MPFQPPAEQVSVSPASTSAAVGKISGASVFVGASPLTVTLLLLACAEPSLLDANTTQESFEPSSAVATE